MGKVSDLILYYQPQSDHWVEESLGFKDPNHDGQLTIRELKTKDNAFFQYFYHQVLSQKERDLLFHFSRNQPLTKHILSQTSELSPLFQKKINAQAKYEIFYQNTLPQQIDAKKLNFQLYQNTRFYFSTMTLDWQDIQSSLSNQDLQTLLKSNLNSYPTNTVLILRHFIQQNSNQPQFQITWQDWQKAYHQLAGKSSKHDSAESTWNEVLLIWQKSNPEWNFFWKGADWAYDKTHGGLIRLGQPDLTLRALGLKRYLNKPHEFIYPNPTHSHIPKATLSQGKAQWRATWPQHPTNLTLAEKWGVGLNLNISANAQAIASQSIEKNELLFHTAQPLLQLEGFSIDVDAVKVWTQQLAHYGQKLSAKFSKDFDFESLDVIAITTFRNRLCLVLQGEANQRDVIKPLGDELLFLDISPFITAQMDQIDPSQKLKNLFFDASGNLYDTTSVDDLQKILLQILQNSSPGKKTPSPQSHRQQNPPLPAHNEVFLQDVSFHLTPSNTQTSTNSIKIHQADLVSTKIYGEGSKINQLTIQGKSELQLSLSLNQTPETIQAPLEFYYDAQQQAGFIRLQLPHLNLKALQNSSLFSQVSGEILIGFDLSVQHLLKNGAFNLEKFLESLALKTLISLQNKHQNKLTTYIKLKDVALDPATQKLNSFLLDYDLALQKGDQKLSGAIQDGQLLLINSSNQTLPFFQIQAEKVKLNGLTNLLGENTFISIYQDPKGHYHLYPVIKNLTVHSPFDSQASQIRGEILLIPSEKGFKIGIKNWHASLQDMMILAKKGYYEGQADFTLNGQWQTQAKSLDELFKTTQNWQGSGKADLLSHNLKYHSYHDSLDTHIQADAPKLTAQIDISQLSLFPLKLSGKTNTQISQSEIDVDTPLFSAHSKLKGNLNLQGKYPLVVFTESSAQSHIHDAPLNPVELPENVLDQSFDESLFLNELLSPLIQQMMATPSTYYEAEEYINRDYPYEAVAKSILDANFLLEKLPIMTGAEYLLNERKQKELAPFLFYTGLFRFLNPRIEKGTYLHTSQTQNLVKNQTLQPCRIDLSHPIHFLGMKITGIGLEYKKCLFQNKNNLHLYLFTPHKKIDVVALLRLKYMCKLQQVYRNMRKQGIKIHPNEIPQNLEDFSLFFTEVLKTFEIDEKVKKQASKKIRPFTFSELQDLTRSSRKKIWNQLSQIEIPLSQPTFGGTNNLKRYLNSASKLENLAEILQQHIDIFDENSRSYAQGYLDEIFLIQFNRQNQDSQEDNNEQIRKLNYKLLRLFLKPYLPQISIIDFENSESLEFQGQLLPKAADYKLFQVLEDAKAPISIKGSYNPTNDSKRSLPGFYLDVAYEDDEAIENVSYQYKTSTLMFGAEFQKISGLKYYLSPYQNGVSNFSVDLNDFEAKNAYVSYMPPTPFHRPAFALFSPDNPGITENNFISGQKFYIDSFNENVHTNFDIHQAYAENSFIYFYLGDKGEEKDVLIDANQAIFKKIKAQTEHNYQAWNQDYDDRLNHISGYMLIDNLPDNKPRAMFYLGNESDGTRRYLILNQLASKGKFYIQDNALLIQAYVGFLATLPDFIYKSPQSQSLKEKGIDFNIQAIEVDGTMDLIFDKNWGGIKKLSESLDDLLEEGELASVSLPYSQSDLVKANQDFQAVQLKLYGHFQFQHNGSVITLKNITIPLESLLIKLNATSDAFEANLSQILLSYLKIPKDHQIRGNLDAHVHLPHSIPSPALDFNNATFSIESKSDFEYEIDENKFSSFQSDGLKLNVHNEENTLDLETGKLTFQNTNGEIQNWQLNLESKNLIEALVVEALLQGEELQFQIKKSENAE